MTSFIIKFLGFVEQKLKPYSIVFNGGCVKVKQEVETLKASSFKRMVRVKRITKTKLLSQTKADLCKIHRNSLVPQKKQKSKLLTKEQRQFNRELAAQRMLCECVICVIKRFKIVVSPYRNHRRRFNLRFNFITGIYNYELAN
jgi:hypothetical protein